MCTQVELQPLPVKQVGIFVAPRFTRTWEQVISQNGDFISAQRFIVHMLVELRSEAEFSLSVRFR